MTESLSALLENGEVLKFPIYATLLEKKTNWFGFFGLTDKHLLIALLKGSSKEICWTNRIPLDIKTVKIKKSLIPHQYKIRIEFNEGLPCNLRVSKKVYGIESQEENLDKFIKYIQGKLITI